MIEPATVIATVDLNRRKTYNSQLSTLAPMEQPCHHGYTQAPGLSPDLSTSVCAVCSTEARIAEVKIAQAALARRGGIFYPSIAGADWCTTDRDIKKWMTHRDWTKQWRKTRINCWRLVAMLEDLRDERFEMVEEWGIDEALYLWELAKDECSQVPGHPHVEECALTENKQMPQSHDMQAVPKPEFTEEDPHEGDWETVKRRWKKRSQPLISSHQDEFKQENTDEVILKEMKGVTDKLEDLKSTSRNRFEALAKGHKHAPAGVVEPTEESKHVPNGDATSVKMDSLQETVPWKTRSALKCNSSSPPHPAKSVSIDAQATILPLNTAPITTTPHHEHTVAEKSRNRLSYNRNSRFYTPSCWASPEGYEKDNTSHFKDTWATVERLQEELEISEEDSNEKDEAFTGKAEEAATGGEKNTEDGERKAKSPFQSLLPPWQPGQKMFSMKRIISESITEGWRSLPDFGNGNGPTMALDRLHQKDLWRASRDRDSALALGERKKVWLDAESER